MCTVKEFFYSSTSKIVLTKNTIKIIQTKNNFEKGYFDTFSSGSFNLHQYDSNRKEFFREYTKEQLKKIEENREFERMKYYSKRKQQIIDIVNCNSFDTFMTVTFENDLTDSEIKEEWTKIKKRIQRVTGNKLNYICRIEKGHKGTQRNHLHLLLNVPYLDNNSKYYNFKGKREPILNKNWNEISILELIKNTRNNKELKEIRERMYQEGASFLKVICACGHIDIQKISNKKKVAVYCAKYITKDIDQTEKGKRIVWTTKALEKPVKVYNSDVIKYILEQHSYIGQVYEPFIIENEFIISATYTLPLKDLYYQIKEVNKNYNIDRKLQLIKLDNQYNMNSKSSLLNVNKNHYYSTVMSSLSLSEKRKVNKKYNFVDTFEKYKKFGFNLQNDYYFCVKCKKIHHLNDVFAYRKDIKIGVGKQC